MKNQKGITLIMLVVTIVVMLLIAGVSLSIVFQNNGIISQTVNSKIYMNVAGVEEEITSRIITGKEVEEDLETQVDKGYMKKIVDSTGKEIYWITTNGLKNLAPGYEKDISDDIIQSKIAEGIIVDGGNLLIINDVSDIYSSNIYVIDNNLKVSYISDKVYGEGKFSYSTGSSSSDVWWKEKPEEIDVIDDSIEYSSSDKFLYDDPANPNIIIGFSDEIINYTGDLVIPAEREIKDRNGNVVEKIRITEIRENAFNKNITVNGIIEGNVTIANGIKIGNNAFKNQTLIKDVIINTKEIGESAFEDCSGITSIQIDGMTKIPAKCFKNAVTLSTKNITIGDSVKEIAESAFEGGADCTEIRFSKNLERIEKRAFADFSFQSNIEKIDLSYCTKLEYIGQEAFKGYKKVNELKLPTNENGRENILSINSGAFQMYSNEEGETMEFDVILDDNITYKTDSFSANINVIGGKRI